jgi:hypothetical protein
VSTTESEGSNVLFLKKILVHLESTSTIENT